MSDNTCSAYLWRDKRSDTEVSLCGCQVGDNGQYCNRHAKRIHRRETLGPVPADGDLGITEKHWAPTKKEIDDESYKPIYRDEATEKLFVPWFCPGEIYRIAFERQIAQLENEQGGEIILSRYPSKKYGKIPRAMKVEKHLWNENCRKILTNLKHW